MADDNHTLELIILGVIAGGFLTFLAMTINNQLQLLNQNISTYNQYTMYQQYQLPQVQQSPQISPSPIQLQPKRLYQIERDADGYILLQ